MDPGLVVTGPVLTWRGPAPHHFVAVEGDDAADLTELMPQVTYGWGMAPVRCRLGATEWETSLWPREGRWLVPLKAAVRRSEGVGVGDVVTVELEVRGAPGR